MDIDVEVEAAVFVELVFNSYRSSKAEADLSPDKGFLVVDIRFLEYNKAERYSALALRLISDSESIYTQSKRCKYKS